jgi:hypothetical protein
MGSAGAAIEESGRDALAALPEKAADRHDISVGEPDEGARAARRAFSILRSGHGP